MKFLYPAKLSLHYLISDIVAILDSSFSKEEKKKIEDIFGKLILSNDGPYEKGNCILEKGDYILDIGANIGIFSVYASGKIGSSGKVYAFEPIHETRLLLEKNLRINNVENVEVNSLALGNDLNEIVLLRAKNNLGSASLFLKRRGIKEGVKQSKLDLLMREGIIGKVDFIKADIEGMEKEMILGAKEIIQKQKPKISICIYHKAGDREELEKEIKNINSEYIVLSSKHKLYFY